MASPRSPLDLDDRQFWLWCEARDFVRKHGPSIAAGVGVVPLRDRQKLRRWLKRDQTIIELHQRQRRGGLRLVKK